MFKVHSVQRATLSLLYVILQVIFNVQCHVIRLNFGPLVSLGMSDNIGRLSELSFFSSENPITKTR